MQTLKTNIIVSTPRMAKNYNKPSYLFPMENIFILGMILGLLVFANKNMPPSIIKEKTGSVTVRVQPHLMVKSTPEIIQLQLDEKTSAPLHLRINSISPWQLIIEPSPIFDADTMERLEDYELKLHFNGKELPRIISGFPKDKEIEVNPSIVSKKAIPSSDFSRRLRCDLNVLVIGIQ